MTTDTYKRKLTAVFSADVAGYSRLMGEDEQETVKTLTTYREIMASLIKQHRGRVVDSPGDNVLAEFGSVVDAVQCAVAVQKEFQARNAELPVNRRMEFRMGVNLGDVIEEEDRIYGDGVNIAARLESLADPGGICISKTAFDHIETKLPLGYEFLGEQEVKNISKPVGAYKVIMEPRITVAGKQPTYRKWKRPAIAAGIAALIVIVAGVLWYAMRSAPPSIEPASVDKMAQPLPDKPSIAVLPFTNIGGDPEQDYLTDGLTEELITALAKIPRVFVIASNSVFTYKGKPVKIQQVSEELGVRYVLEGSVRKSRDQIRITAQLIDAIGGHHLWAERYEGKVEDLFAFQDAITSEILTSLEIELTEGEQARVWRRSTYNPRSYEKYLQALEAFRLFSREGNTLARKRAQEALEIDPKNVVALVTLAWTYLRDVWLGWSESPKEYLEKSVELAKEAIALDESNPDAHALLGSIYLLYQKYDEAISEGRRAVELSPNSGDITALYSITLRDAGRYEEAIELGERAVRLSPITPNWYFHNLAFAYQAAGKTDNAIELFRKVIQRNPNHFPAWMGLASIYGDMGRNEEAHEAAKEVLRLNPKFSIENYYKNSPIKDQALIQRRKEGLLKAGLPE
jgi:adenylate cyclase